MRIPQVFTLILHLHDNNGELLFCHLERLKRAQQKL